MATYPSSKQSKSEILVRESEDFEYLATVAGQKPTVAGKLKAAGLFFYEVLIDGQRAGVWLFIPKPVGVEMHTELNEKCHGKTTLEAARQLAKLLRARGVELVTTYAPHANRVAKIMAVAAGFRRVCADADNVYYERRLTHA